MGTESMRIHEEHFVPIEDMGTIPSILGRFLNDNEIEPGSLEIFLFAGFEWDADFNQVHGQILQLAGTVWSHDVHPISGHSLERQEQDG